MHKERKQFDKWNQIRIVEPLFYRINDYIYIYSHIFHASYTTFYFIYLLRLDDTWIARKRLLSNNEYNQEISQSQNAD